MQQLYFCCCYCCCCCCCCCYCRCRICKTESGPSWQGFLRDGGTSLGLCLLLSIPFCIVCVRSATTLTTTFTFTFTFTTKRSNNANTMHHTSAQQRIAQHLQQQRTPAQKHTHTHTFTTLTNLEH